MEGRDKNGRFIKGWKGNPNAKGRPTKKREDRYYEIAITTVTYDQWEKIIKRAGRDAEKGDSTARKFLADYLIGPPAQRHELSGPGGGPIETTDARTNLLAAIEREMEEFDPEAEIATSEGSDAGWG